MPNPFEDARRKVTRADEHFADLCQKINAYTQENPLEKVIEPHPTKPDHQLHKLKLTKSLPPSFGDITGDIVHNLRSALDVATYSIALGSGCQNPKYSSFPFAGSLSQMGQALGRTKDLPIPIQSLFVGFQPYLGGDDLLWALNEMCNTDKHKMLIPMGNVVVRVGADVRGTGYFSMPDPHIWNREKGEMDVITLGPGAEFNCFFDFRVFVAVNEVRVVDGKPIIETLHKIGSRILDMLNVIEAESRRLGYTS